ncbi:MAG: hypothetical protein JHC66_07315 [Acidimicrobiia bacterium]|nr:hypothetical protein [Acidimicrobiia bacterium]
MTSTEQAKGSNGSTGERAGKRRRNIILGAVAVGVLALALLAVGVLPRNSATSGCNSNKTDCSTPTTTTTAPSTGGGSPTPTTAPSTGGGSPTPTTAP